MVQNKFMFDTNKNKVYTKNKKKKRGGRRWMAY